MDQANKNELRNILEADPSKKPVHANQSNNESVPMKLVNGQAALDLSMLDPVMKRMSNLRQGNMDLDKYIEHFQELVEYLGVDFGSVYTKETTTSEGVPLEAPDVNTEALFFLLRAIFINGLSRRKMKERLLETDVQQLDALVEATRSISAGLPPKRGTDSEGAMRELSQSDMTGRLLIILKRRLPWLLVALVGGLIAGIAVEGFEDLLDEVTAVSFLLPLVMDMGGNVGTQASSIFVRGLSCGDINSRTFKAHIIREAIFGTVTGVIVGVVTFAAVWIWQGAIQGASFAVRLAFAAGISLFIISILGVILGSLIPLAVNKLKLDTAAVSDPMITTIKDVSGVLIYLGFAVALLGGEYL